MRKVVRYVLHLDRLVGDDALRAATASDLQKSGFVEGTDDDGPEQIGRRLIAAFRALMYLVRAAHALVSQSSVCVSVCEIWTRLRGVDPKWLRPIIAPAPFLVIDANVVELLALELVAPSLLLHRHCGTCVLVDGPV